MDSKAHDQYGAAGETHLTQRANISPTTKGTEGDGGSKTDRNTRQRLRVSFSSNVDSETSGITSCIPSSFTLGTENLSRSLPSLVDSRTKDNEDGMSSRTRSMIHPHPGPRDEESHIHSVNNQELGHGISTTNDTGELRDMSHTDPTRNDIDGLADELSSNHVRTNSCNLETCSDCEECFESDFTVDILTDTLSLRERLSRFSFSGLITPRRRRYTRISRTGTLVTDSFTDECVCCCVIL